MQPSESSESTELPNRELLSRAHHDAEQAAGNLLAQSPPREATRHETARGDTAAQPGTSPPRLRLAPLLAVDVPSNAPNLCGPAQEMLEETSQTVLCGFPSL